MAHKCVRQMEDLGWRVVVPVVIAARVFLSVGQARRERRALLARVLLPNILGWTINAFEKRKYPHIHRSFLYGNERKSNTEQCKGSCKRPREEKREEATCMK